MDEANPAIAALMLQRAALRKKRPRQIKVDLAAIRAQQAIEDAERTPKRVSFSVQKKRKSTPRPKTPDAVHPPLSERKRLSSALKSSSSKRKLSSADEREEAGAPYTLSSSGTSRISSLGNPQAASSPLNTPITGQFLARNVRRDARRWFLSAMRERDVSPSFATSHVSQDLTAVNGGESQSSEGREKSKKRQAAPVKKIAKRLQKQDQIDESTDSDVNEFREVSMLDLGYKRPAASVTDLDVIFSALERVCNECLNECDSAEAELAIEAFYQHVKESLQDMLEEREEAEERMRISKRVERRKRHLRQEMLLAEKEIQKNTADLKRQHRKQRGKKIQEGQRKFAAELKKFFRDG